MKLFYYLILRPLSLLPEGIRKPLSSLTAFVLYRVIGYRRKMIEHNLAICFPDKDQAWVHHTTKEFYSNLGDIITESIQSFSISKNAAIKRVHALNPEVLKELYDKGKSVILTGGHYVNWEAMTLLGDRVDHEIYALYKPLKNVFMDNKVQSSRGKFGTHMISVKDYRRYFVDLQERPKLFIFGIDQSPRKGKGIWMDFLNRETLVFTGPERLAKEFDLAVVMGRMSRIEKGRYELRYELLTKDPKSTSENEITLATNKDLEEQIIENPSGWLWSHNRWKHKREDGE
jgi:KDO2-lipid IV(A) lauroyltransferase